jgi:hypothetical protein
MRRKEKGEFCSGYTASFLSLPSDSQGPGVKNMKSITKLNGMWLRIGATSLSQC